MEKNPWEKLISDLKRFKKGETKQISKDFLSGENPPDHAAVIAAAISHLENWFNAARGVKQTPRKSTKTGQMAEASEAEFAATWQNLFDNRRAISIDFISFFTRHMPVTDKIDWVHVVKLCNYEQLLDGILQAKQIKKSALKKAVDTAPEEFYLSVVVDKLLDSLEGGTLARFWEICLTQKERPTNLLSRFEIMYQIVAHWRELPDPSALLGFLISDSDDARWFREKYFRDSGLAYSFGDLLLQTVLTNRDSSASKTVIQRAIKVVIDIFESDERNHRNGIWMLGTIRLFLERLGDKNDLLFEVENYIQQVALKSLLRLEQDPASETGKFMTVLPNSMIYKLHGDFINQLGKTTQRHASEATRESVVRESRVKLEILRELIDISTSTSGENSLLQNKLDAMLFNQGVRKIEQGSDTERFDSQKHYSKDTLILPGDEIVVEESGFVMGVEDEAIVLKKARVTLKNTNCD